MLVIFVASSDLMSSEHTSRVIGPLLHWMFPSMSPFSVVKAELLVRKAAHVTEYAVLASLLFRALVHTVLKGKTAFALAAALFFCALYAASDEFHQAFVPSRTASLRDVAIDVMGALLALSAYWLLMGRHPELARRQSPVSK